MSFRRRMMMAVPNKVEVINFVDAEVKRILVERWGGADGGTGALNTRVNNIKVPGIAGEMTYEQAASVLNLSNTFKGNTIIRDFDELQFFTGITQCPVFQGCTLNSLIIPNNVILFGDNIIYSTNITNMHILGNSVSSVAGYSFRSTNITNLYLKTLDFLFSYNCTNAEQSPLWITKNLYIDGILTTHIDIPERITTLYSWFASSAIHSMTLPNTLVAIGNNAFRKTRMQTLTIPATVTSLGNSIIYNTTLPEMIFLSTTPPTANTATWGGSGNLGVIKVPAESVEAYKTAPNWSNVANKIQAIS